MVSEIWNGKSHNYVQEQFFSNQSELPWPFPHSILKESQPSLFVNKGWEKLSLPVINFLENRPMKPQDIKVHAFGPPQKIAQA